MGRTSSAGHRDIDALSSVLRERARKERIAGAGRVRLSVGDWSLGTDAAGNLVAVHQATGVETVLASPPVNEGKSDG